MRPIDSIRRSSNYEAILEKARHRYLARDTALEATTAVPDPDPALEALRGTRSIDRLDSKIDVEVATALEAIILDRMRPAYFIVDEKIEIKGEYDRVDLVEQHKAMLESIARSVGRVDLFHHPTLNYAGTGWLIEEDLAVTNRHVALVFAELLRFGNIRFRRGAFSETVEARFDYLRQRDDTGQRRRADVVDVLYITGSKEPDIAFLKVEVRSELTPLELHTSGVEDGMPVATIGYPARDSGRNDPVLMDQLFGGVYEVKRFSPGLITGREENNIVLLGDYTSLGGNSGSPVLDLTTGKAVGLHFAGTFRESNYAVAADIVAAVRTQLTTQILVTQELEPETPASSADTFVGRNGYDPDFLGTGELSVPLPSPGVWADDIAPVSDDANNVLKYRNFSTIQSASRRLPLLTAVNIDGDKTFSLKRRGNWRLDQRLALEHQIGNELYARNPLDRGHMVRRRDPGWGENREQAQEGEIDTFHYTNSAPQHEDLNQKDWVGLEDYILEAAETREFKLSVFTGPVFRPHDPRLKRQLGAEDVQIPEEFWKIAVMVYADTNKLSATGYILSHGPMIRRLAEAAFVFGQYKTYQVPIAQIEAETGLDFDRLREFDPLRGEKESVFGRAAILINDPAMLRL